MNRIAPKKTPDEVKAEFLRKGISIRAWAKANGFTVNLVYEILSGAVNRPCNSGQSHRIAVSLGMKDGEIINAPAIRTAFQQE